MATRTRPKLPGGDTSTRGADLVLHELDGHILWLYGLDQRKLPSSIRGHGPRGPSVDDQPWCRAPGLSDLSGCLFPAKYSVFAAHMPSVRSTRALRHDSWLGGHRWGAVMPTRS